MSTYVDNQAFQAAINQRDIETARTFAERFSAVDKTVPQLRLLRDTAQEILCIALSEELISDKQFVRTEVAYADALWLLEKKEEAAFLRYCHDKVRELMTTAQIILEAPLAPSPLMKPPLHTKKLDLPAWLMVEEGPKSLDNSTRVARILNFVRKCSELRLNA